MTLNRRFALIGHLLILFVIPITAQEPPKKKSNWVEHSHEAGNFTADFPGKPSNTQTSNKNGLVTGSATFNGENSTQWIIQFQVLNFPRPEGDLLEALGVKLLARQAKEVKKIKLGTHPGIEFTATKPYLGKDKKIISRVFAVKDRLYQVNIITPPDGTVPEESIAKFFNSFRLSNEDAKSDEYEIKNPDGTVKKPMVPETPIAKLPIEDEKYTPGKNLYDPKVAEAERKLIPQLRKLPRPGERRVECLGVYKTPFDPRVYAFSPDGSTFAIAGVQQTWLVETETGRNVRTLPPIPTTYRSGSGLRFSADGKTLIGQTDKAIVLYEVATGNLLKDLATPGPTLDCVMSEDGSTLSVAYTSKTGFGVNFAAWNTKDWTRKPIPFPQDLNVAWCFSANGNRVVLVERRFTQNDKTIPPIQAWNLVNGKRSLIPTKYAISYIHLHGDDRTLIVTTMNNPEGFSEVRSLDLASLEDKKLTQCRSASDPARLTPDGKYLLIDHWNPETYVTTKLIDVKTEKELWSQQYGMCKNYLFSPGGMILIRTPYMIEYEVDVLALEDLLNPKWADLGEAMAKLRVAGFYVNPYGNHIRVKPYSSRLNEKSFPELVKLLPQATIVEYRDLFYQSDLVVKSIDYLAELPNLEQLECRQSLGDKPEIRQKLTALKNLKRLELTDDDVGLNYLKDIPKLEELTIRTSKNFTDAGLKNIFAVKTLQQLTITGIGLKITNDGFAGIGELKELRSISTRGGSGPVTSAAFKHFKNCPKLEKIELLDTNIYDADMSNLGSMSQLTEIRLQPTFVAERQLTEAGLKKLSSLKKLRVLKIEASNKISANSLSDLNLQQLEIGDFNGIEFTDGDLSLFQEMPKLKELWITRGPYTDRGLDKLKNLTQLEQLFLTTAPGISEEKVNELKKALPRTKIMRWN